MNKIWWDYIVLLYIIIWYYFDIIWWFGWILILKLGNWKSIWRGSKKEFSYYLIFFFYYYYKIKIIKWWYSIVGCIYIYLKDVGYLWIERRKCNGSFSNLNEFIMVNSTRFKTMEN